MRIERKGEICGRWDEDREVEKVGWSQEVYRFGVAVGEVSMDAVMAGLRAGCGRDCYGGRFRQF